MCEKPRSFWLLAAFCFALVCGSVSAQEAHPSQTFAQRLTQLRTISQKAAQLAQTSQLRLTDSLAQIDSLQANLAQTQAELARFKTDLETQSAQAQLSAQESQTLKETVKILQDSLDKSTADLQTYRTASEAKVRQLESERLAWGIGGAGVGAGVVLALHLLGMIR